MKNIMEQELSKSDINGLKKRYQAAFRRWMLAEPGGRLVAPYIGANFDFVRGYISDRLLEGMTWYNYGSVWVIDHIAPMRLFDMTSEEDLKIVLHYKNLMPLFKEGAIEFSIQYFDSLPACEVIKKLKLALSKESVRLKKYLPTKAPLGGFVW